MADAAPGAKILLSGSTGQVGGELLRLLAPLGEVVTPQREAMDLADADSVRRTIRSVRPRWIVNPAAYTAVDKAESEPGLAYAINRDAVQAIGEEANTINAAVVHFSTDYVFDGTAAHPYRETDATNPVSVYGASKLAGEQALAATGAAHLIFRTSWVYGARGKNFLLTILRLARERETLRVVADQYGAPTWSRDLAAMTAHVIAKCEASAKGGPLAGALAAMGGIYHASGAGETTWHGFAGEAVRLAQKHEPSTRFAAIEAITTAEYPTPAKRPANSRMDSGKLAERFGWRMMEWRESLRKVMAEL
ncbi:dTDP-4-dehydrorhamnose reductase [Edaphobacter sp.]|uniref:dTDP-4-dehydrorhamnose reductase n=1 Tax=Edaphobacter sp. TaxID=1934404 RepID=UPI002DB9A722|nr:dTDP-4-dehydrorhamnose reductase [Edaphobacter sp.]HEU5340054.1 dTDP-4-dehydrorhamnose reductase [Edaphobacter sp.]